ncbi:hypothetical protein ASD48_39325 [Streptomyces sp. Root1310]|nr:hypothetical protein ASD48_39325 [Streptomyces sp. Root1310]
MGGQAAGVCVAGQVSDDGEELGPEDGAHARERFDEFGALVKAEGFADLPVGVFDPFVEHEELVGEVAHEFGGSHFARQSGHLGSGCFEPAGGDVGCTADRTSCQPVRELFGTGSLKGRRGLVLGQHDDRPLGR